MINPRHFFSSNDIYCSKIVDGNFHDAFEHLLAVTNTNTIFDICLKSPCQTFNPSIFSDQVDPKTLLKLALPPLFEFLRLNFICTKPTSFDIPTERNEEATTALLNSSSSFSHLQSSPFLLFFSISLIEHLYKNHPEDIEILVWYFRSLIVFYRCLSDPDEVIGKLLDVISKILPLIEEWEPVEKVLMLFEVSAFYQSIGSASKSSEIISKIQDILNFELVLVGLTGKRTIYQQNSLPQLLVSNQSKETTSVINQSDLESITSLLSTNSFPQQARIDGEIRLKEILLDNSSDDQLVLKSNDLISQILLISILNQVRVSSAVDNISLELQEPWVNAVLRSPLTFMVQLMALLVKSRLDSERPKTYEKSAIQIDRILENSELCGTEECFKHVALFWCLNFESILKLRKELAFRWAKIGMLSTAQELFEKLELFDDAVECLISSKGLTAAKNWISEISQKYSPTPRLLVAQGIVESDSQLFVQAWELSKHQHLPALRALVKGLLTEGKEEEAVTWLEVILKKNSFDSKSWYNLGLIKFARKEYVEAKKCFQKVVLIDDEDFESWSKMGTCSFELGSQKDGMNCLKEALRIRPNSLKLWEYFGSMSMKSKDYQSVIYVFRNILKFKTSKDLTIHKYLPVLAELVSNFLIVEDFTEFHWPDQFVDLMEHIAQNFECDFRFWGLYIEVFRYLKNGDKLLTGLKSRLRELAHNLWQNSQDSVEKVLDTCVDLIEVVTSNDFPKAERVSVRRLVRPLVSLARQNFEHLEIFEIVSAKLELLSNN
ncbi:hypothetical protein GEMRC1_010404 [Eukaryota sp. GEM-RC1]